MPHITNRRLTPEDFQQGWWLTGEQIPMHVSQMDDNHLLNIRRMLLARAEKNLIIAQNSYLCGDGDIPEGVIAPKITKSQIINIAKRHPFWQPLNAEIGRRLGLEKVETEHMTLMNMDELD